MIGEWGSGVFLRALRALRRLRTLRGLVVCGRDVRVPRGWAFAPALCSVPYYRRRPASRQDTDLIGVI